MSCTFVLHCVTAWLGKQARLSFFSASVTSLSFCTSFTERVYITAIGCEIGFDGTKGLQAAGWLGRGLGPCSSVLPELWRGTGVDSGSEAAAGGVAEGRGSRDGKLSSDDQNNLCLERIGDGKSHNRGARAAIGANQEALHVALARYQKRQSIAVSWARSQSQGAAACASLPF